MTPLLSRPVVLAMRIRPRSTTCPRLYVPFVPAMGVDKQPVRAECSLVYNVC